MELTNFLFLISFFVLTSARIYSIENEDGSYTIGHTSDSRGEAANSVLALLTKAAGYTDNTNYEHDSPSDSQSKPTFKGPQQIEEAPQRPQNRGGLLSPHMEILELIEVFLKFKGELASRLYQILSDNYDLIRSISQTLINKIGTLHTFTLIGIKILRKILEFAVTLMVNWQVNLPGASLDLNVGNGIGTNNQASTSHSNTFFNVN